MVGHKDILACNSVMSRQAKGNLSLVLKDLSNGSADAVNTIPATAAHSAAPTPSQHHEATSVYA